MHVVFWGIELPYSFITRKLSIIINHKKMKKIIFAALISGCMLLTSCDVLLGIANQLQGIANLANCEYSLKNINNISVAGVNVKNITNGNISLADVAKLSAALLTKNVPLSMDVNINVKNPTTNNASLTTLDWILELEGKEFCNGTSNKSYSINAGSTSAIPLSVSTDIYSLFSKNGIESLKNFVSSFASDGTSSKVGLKIKPSINVGGVDFPSPKFITLEKQVGGNSSTSTTTTNTNNSGSTTKPTSFK